MKVVRFRIPFVPSSTKNSRRLFRRGAKGVGSLPSKKAEQQKPVIRGIVTRALAALDKGGMASMFGDDDVAVTIRHHVDRGHVEVEVMSLGPKRAKGVTGRGQDLDNTASAIMDAMNELTYDDDRGVSLLHVERVYG